MRPGTRRGMLRIVALCSVAAMALGGATGCTVDSFCLNCVDGAVPDGAPGDGAPPDSPFASDGQLPPTDGATDAGLLPPEAGPDACLDREVCNQRDDDCDGKVDEGIDTSSDPRHCGGCGQACRMAHAFPACNGGTCAIESCEPGWIDLDGNKDNGCEKRCPNKADDDDTCDLVDDDCDGKVDEDVDLQTDPANCGSCGHTCAFRNATAVCEGGECTLDTCDSGFRNLDGMADNGCEYACPDDLTDETCNAIDDDCDGKVDEGNPGGGEPCGNGTGACTPGTTSCEEGRIVCQGGTSGSAEVCDANTAPSLEAADNDCDGKVDENFDLNNDRDNCGECGNECSFDNAFAKCDGGSCVMTRCKAGFHDVDGNTDNGCELECEFQGQEICNGKDDDCDGQTDEDLTKPANFCNPNDSQVCADATVECQGSDGWMCNYPADFESPETTCDGKDNDCDGAVDESHPLAGEDCSNGTGQCKNPGTYECTEDGNDVKCTAGDPGSPSPEVCDTLDNDCDGAVDEGGTEDDGVGLDDLATVEVDPASGTTLHVMQYEASRPDATSTSGGTASTVACSTSGVMPWTNVTWTEARDACCALNADGTCPGSSEEGWRLCNAAQWESACQGPADSCTWSYQSSCGSSAPQTCNGEEYDCDQDSTNGDQDCLKPTGSASFPECKTVWSSGGVHDLSGNAKEWTSSSVDTGVYELRGGAYTNIEDGRTCTFDFTVAEQDFAAPNTGFRCCYRVP